MNTDFRYRNKALLWLLLIVLNIIIRIPSAPHEIGGDTYQLHAIANSLSQFGEARWWVNWLSAFGMYSYSYASAIPFLLSGISQSTGIDMELTVFLYSLCLGLLSTGTAYIMAGSIYDEFLPKYFMSLFYSISSGLLAFTSWNASARGLFLVLFPLFIFILLKELSSTWKKLILTVLVLISLRATHNFFYFALPLVLVFILGKIISKTDFSSKNIKLIKYQNCLYMFLTCILLIIPFFTKLFITGSKYQGLINILITTTRYIGPIIIFLIPGFLYLYLKDNKTKNENLILFSTLFFIPISFSPIYGKFVILPLAIFYISIAVRNIAINGRYRAVFLALLIISLSCFSSFYSHFRTGSSDDYFSMSERCNTAGLWTKNYMHENTRVYTTGGEVWRMLAVSDGHINIPTTPPLSLIYGFVDNVSSSTIKTSPYSTDYYFEAPYIQINGTSTWGEYQWHAYLDIEDKRVKNFVEKYNLKYVIDDSYSGNRPLTISLKEEKSLVYNDGRINIWDI